MKHTVLSLKSIVQSRSEISSELEEPGDAVLIIRGQPRWLLVKCPCGCDDEVPLNLDWRAGNAWRIYGARKKHLTLFPSVWRDTGCLSHFIIRNSQILLMDETDFLVRRLDSQSGFPSLLERVKEYWPSKGWVHYVEVADQLGEIPWDVLDACRYFVQDGIFVEGFGELHSNFRRRQFEGRRNRRTPKEPE